MRLLLDTHCWIWMLAFPERFSRRSRALLEGGENELYLSAASMWEIVLKHALGRLALAEPPATAVPALVARTRTSRLPIREDHCLALVDLPLHHRDPFDRMLIAQARVEGLPILTSDRRFHDYDVETIRT